MQRKVGGFTYKRCNKNKIKVIKISKNNYNVGYYFINYTGTK